METATQLHTSNCAYYLNGNPNDCSCRRALAPQETPAQHSPLPWRVYSEDDRYIVGRDTGSTLAYGAAITGWGNVRQSKADAELIVKCVNRDPAFQKLVKTLDDLCGFLNVTPLRLNEGDSMTLSMLTDSAREALRLAREGE